MYLQRNEDIYLLYVYFIFWKNEKISHAQQDVAHRVAGATRTSFYELQLMLRRVINIYRLRH